VWIYTQSNITQASYSPEYITSTQQISLNNIVEPESGVTNCEQCGQHNIVQSCFHQYCNNLIIFSCVCIYCFIAEQLLCNPLLEVYGRIDRVFRPTSSDSHDITILLQPCVVNLVIFLRYHDCIRLVRTTL
jgi:hypothetical protein